MTNNLWKLPLFFAFFYARTLKNKKASKSKAPATQARNDMRIREAFASRKYAMTAKERKDGL